MKHNKKGRKKALDKQQIEYAKYLRENGLNLRLIGKIFGVSRMSVWRCLQ